MGISDESLSAVRWYIIIALDFLALCTILFLGSIHYEWKPYRHQVPIEINSTRVPIYEPMTFDPPKRVEPAPIPVAPKPAPQPTAACVELGSGYWGNYIANMSATESEKAWLMRTASCESGMRNCAFSGTYCGIMQFHPQTFASAGGSNIWDGAQQLTLALNHYRVHGSGAWPHCGN